ncbi:MAG: hypothetical protein JW825_01530 [Candidatus Methanofastidiosa archaeon]|nr:hypothetical protein [Candidatus Methanofastidiosa archaeon]
MIGILFTVYSIGLAYALDGAPIYIAILGGMAALAMAAKYLENTTLSVVSIIVASMVLGHALGAGSIYRYESLASLLAIAVPMLISIEGTLNRARGHALPKIAKRSRKGLLPPALYIALVCASMMIITQSRMYETYFMGDGNPMMQVLLLTGLAGIFFIPLYERYSL